VKVKEKNKNRGDYIIGIFVLISTIIVGTLIAIIARPPRMYPDEAFLLMGIDEPPAYVSRGRIDLMILFIDRKTHIEAIQFPRDALVYFPQHGHWRINASYLYYSAFGTARYMEELANIRVKNFYAIDLPGLRTLMTNIMLDPTVKPFTKHMKMTSLEETEDWLRHRHSFQWEIHRQLRLQAFLSKMHTVSRTLGVFVPVRNIATNMINTALSTDMNTNELITTQRWLMANKIEWKMYQGRYEWRSFDYHFLKDKIWVWIHDPDAPLGVIIDNPYYFSLKNFLGKKTNIHPNIPVKTHYTNGFVHYTSFNSHFKKRKPDGQNTNQTTWQTNRTN